MRIKEKIREITAHYKDHEPFSTITTIIIVVALTMLTSTQIGQLLDVYYQVDADSVLIVLIIYSVGLIMLLPLNVIILFQWINHYKIINNREHPETRLKAMTKVFNLMVLATLFLLAQVIGSMLTVDNASNPELIATTIRHFCLLAILILGSVIANINMFSKLFIESCDDMEK